MEEELQKEDIEKFQRVLQPVLAETVTSPIHKLQEAYLKQIETRQLEAIEVPKQQSCAIEGRAPSEVLEAVLKAVESKEPINLDRAEGTLVAPSVAPSVLRIDPDKGMDFELLDCYKFLKPSEILREEEPQELVTAYIADIDYNLKSWGGRIAKIQDKDSKEYKQLRRKIDGLRAYKDRIKDLLKALPLAGGGASSCCPKGRILNSRESTRLFSKNCRIAESRIEYKYYSSPDELINRLELLYAERDIGNDSIEVRNEIMAILDILLKNKIIDKVHHKEMFRKWCS